MDKSCEDYVEDAHMAITKAILRCRYRGASQALREAQRHVVEAAERMQPEHEPDQEPVYRD